MPFSYQHALSLFKHSVSDHLQQETASSTTCAVELRKTTTKLMPHGSKWRMEWQLMILVVWCKLTNFGAAMHMQIGHKSNLSYLTTLMRTAPSAIKTVSHKLQQRYTTVAIDFSINWLLFYQRNISNTNERIATIDIKRDAKNPSKQRKRRTRIDILYVSKTKFDMSCYNLHKIFFDTAYRWSLIQVACHQKMTQNVVINVIIVLWTFFWFAPTLSWKSCDPQNGYYMAMSYKMS